MFKKLILFPISFILANSTWAENIQFQNIQVGGTGCPIDKTQIILSPDQTTASLIFQDFESHVPQSVSNSKKASPYISELPCNVFLEIKLPIGQKLDSLEIGYDMRGNAALDRGVSGNFQSYLISSNGLGVERHSGPNPTLLQEKSWQNYTIDQLEDFTVQTSKVINFGSDCRSSNGGDRVAIHLQHHLFTQIQRGFENTSAAGSLTIDTSDLSGGIKLKAHTQVCTPNDSTDRPAPDRPGRRNCRIIRIGGRAQQICQ